MYRLIFLLLLFPLAAYSQPAEWIPLHGINYCESAEPEVIDERILACSSGPYVESWRFVTIGGACPEGAAKKACEYAPGDPCESPNVWDQDTQKCVGPSCAQCNQAIINAGVGGSCTISNNGQLNCTIGGGGPPGSPPPCQASASGGACYNPPGEGPTPGPGHQGPDPRCGPGYTYGTINGNATCVSTSGSSGPSGSSPGSPGGAQTAPGGQPNQGPQFPEGGGMGPGGAPPSNPNPQPITTSPPSPGGESTRTRSYIDDNGDTITETETRTRERTIEEGDEPYIPYTCNDGRAAFDFASCDSNVTCSSNEYIVYGTCVPLPTRAVRNEHEEETVTRTVRNETTNEIIHEEEEEGDSTTPTYGGGGDGQGETTVEVDLELPFAMECDPTAINYNECMGITTSAMPEHTDNGGDTYETGLIALFNRISQAPIMLAMEDMKTIVPAGNGSCPLISMDLSATIIGSNISTSIHCDILETIRPILTPLMFVLFAIAAFRVFASA